MTPILGLKKGRVVVEPYNDLWPVLFNREATRIREAIGPHIRDIQHIGSTSVPGLSAKPILDIAIAVDTFEASVVCVSPLEELGYRHLGENGIPRRRYFEKGTPETHHLHMFEINSDDWRRHLYFRDLLRVNADLVNEYAVLKEQLAERYPDNIEAYQKGKAACIKRVQNLSSPVRLDDDGVE